jgi:hypothetical protein
MYSIGETSRRLCTCAIVPAFVSDEHHSQFISLSVFAGILDRGAEAV